MKRTETLLYAMATLGTALAMQVARPEAAAGAEQAAAVRDMGRAAGSEEQRPIDSAGLRPISDVDYDSLYKFLRDYRDHRQGPGYPWGGDPFARTPGFAMVDPALEQDKIGQLKLDAVIFDDKSPMAMINKEIVYPGDEIEGFQVTQIGPNFVVLEGGGTRMELTLAPAPPSERKAEINALPRKEKP